MRKGGDGYFALQNSVLEPHKRNGQYIGPLVLEYLMQKKKVAPKLEQRLVDISNIQIDQTSKSVIQNNTS
jgi:hypothetical protein